MLIKQKLKLSILLFTLFSLAFAFMQFKESQRIASATSKHESINTIGTSTIKLHLLTHDFVDTNNNNDPKVQWLKTFKKIDLLLKNPNFQTDKSEFITNDITKKLNNAGQIFAQLTNTSPLQNIKELEKQISRITVMMIKQTFGLSMANKQEIIESKNNSTTMTIAFCLFLLTLLIANFIFITKNILKPFSILNEDLQKAAAGELTYRDPNFKTDEFGDMAQTFYKIADCLQWTTHSLDKIEQSKEAVNTKADWAQGLQEIAEQLSHSTSRKSVIDIIHSTSSHIEGIRAWPALPNKYGSVVSFHDDKQIAKQLGDEFQKCIDDVFQNHIIRYSGDIKNKPECQACLNIEEAKYCAVFPLMVGEKCLGALTFIIFIDQDYFPIEKYLLPLLDVFSKQVANTFHRITTRQELQNSIINAEEANKAKNKFLANMSHEIRPPLNAILGINYLLLQTPLNNIQENYVNKAEVSARLLQETINAILDFSKIEANAMESDHTEFCIEDLLKDIREVNAIRAQAKGLELLYIYDQIIPYKIWGDPFRLGQVINNLISNAIKFTNHGEIVLMVKLQQEHLGQAIIQFSVHDSGIGIPKDKKEKLFDKFTQLDSSSARQYGDTGLGLAICKQLVEQMGGEIWTESDLGIGTTFHFTTKFEIGTARKDHTLSLNKKIKEARILIAGQSSKNNLIMRNTLLHFSPNVDMVTSGSAAIKRIKHQSNIDLVVLDSMISDFDHQEFQEFKEDVFPTKIILTARNIEQKNLDFINDNVLFDGYLTRPFTPSDVLNTLMTVFNQQEELQERDDLFPSLTPTHRLDGVSILLVEDNEINQMIAQDIIKSFGANVSIASNGQECLNMLDQHFDLILMDIQMPIMDGYETTKKIRNHTTYKNLPILAMTASSFQDDQDKALEAGMNDYVSKPIDSIQLNEALFRWVKGQASEVIHSKMHQHHQELSDILKSISELDCVAGLERVSGQMELYKKLLKRFVAEKSSFTEDIQNAFKHQNWNIIIENAHALKGAAGNLGAMEIYDKALKLEKTVRSHQYDNVQIILNELCKKLQYLLADLEKI